MSCALDSKFGMQALKNHLCQNIMPSPNDSEQGRQWKKVEQSLQHGNDLESSLDNVTSPLLLEEITCATSKFISSIDQDYAFKIANKEVEWPATALFRRLFEALPTGDPILHVLTPNYDTLFEHACDSIGIPYTSGFHGGIQRRLCWPSAAKSFSIPQKSKHGSRLRRISKIRPHIRLYKVHGSLNFFSRENSIVENNAWMWSPPNFSKRIVITPGLSKYEKIQTYRQELQSYADMQIEKASRFLFLGYGFNDHHLDVYIKRKLIDQKCNGLIVVKETNTRIDSLLDESENLWLVSKGQGADRDGTRIFNKKYAEPLNLVSTELWKVDNFAKRILGE